MQTIVRKIIVPSRIIYKRKLFKITYIKQKYVIRKYCIKTIRDKFISLYLDSLHPNADSSGEFCVPYKITNITFKNNLKNILESMIYTFNLDDCYFKPWGEIEYEEIN